MSANSPKEGAGKFGDIGTVTRFAVGVRAGFPHAWFRWAGIEDRHCRRQQQPDRVRQASLDEEVQEVMSAASGIRVDEHGLTRTRLAAAQASEKLLTSSMWSAAVLDPA